MAPPRSSRRKAPAKPARAHAAPPKRATAIKTASAPLAPDGALSGPSIDLAPVVGANLRRLRSERALSLEKLALLSGVSRAMLGQIELGQSAPTINVLWKIAYAFGVPFSTLLASSSSSPVSVIRSSDAKRLTSHDGRFVSRALSPASSPHHVEFYELRLAANATEVAEAHPPGTTETLVVSQGILELERSGVTYQLGRGDSIFFEADVAHCYRNPSDVEGIFFLVMTYASASR